MSWQLLSQLLGGLGLFLIGIEFMRSGFKEAAGNSLRRILSDFTDTVPKGLFAGYIVSSATQSASAVTLTAIGFVNAQILRLRQAVSIVLGSNLGKITTAWFIAILGVKIQIGVYALPLIGVGALLRLVLKERRQGYAFALVGFSMIFLGIGFLKDAITVASSNFNFSTGANPDLLMDLMYFGIGVAMTVITQSSGAAIAILLSGLSAGLINIEPAAAMMVGLNLGTTSNAYLVSMRASPNAKRLAFSHIMFNLLCTVLGSGLLYVTFRTPALEKIDSKLWLISPYLESHPIISLTIFYTAFIVLSLCLVLPFFNRFVRWLNRRFLNTTTLGTPRHLPVNTKTLLNTENAIKALEKECLRLAKISLGTLRDVLVWNTKKGWIYSEDLSETNYELDTLNEHIHVFATNYTQDNASTEQINRIQVLCRAAQHFNLCSDFTYAISKFKNKLTDRLDTKLIEDLSLWSSEMDALVKKIKNVFDDGRATDLKSIHNELKVLDEQRRALRYELIELSISGRITSKQSSILIDVIETARRAVREMIVGSYKLVDDSRELGLAAEKGFEEYQRFEQEKLDKQTAEPAMRLISKDD